MEIIIQPDPEAAARLAAHIIAKRLREKPDLVLGLATGNTMEKVYGMLAETHEKQNLSFARCTTFNLDEYIGLPENDPNSYRTYMNTRLFDKVDIPIENTHMPNGNAADFRAESERYEQAILAAGGIDLQLLGIGRDGHIGFNEPMSALRSRTREKALTPETLLHNAGPFGAPENVPRRAITMGVGTILDSRRCLMLATGAGKAAIVAKALEGPITAMVSASALQLHPHCTVIVDEPAASKLQGKPYYRWIFEHEPEWKEFRVE